MAGYRTAAPADLERLAGEVFAAAGTPEDIAQQVAGHLIRANLSGHDSHGILRVSQYVQMIDDDVLHPAARPQVLRERGATALVDARRGFGQHSTAVALDLALAKATELGAGIVTIRQSNHIGRVGHYTEAAARRGWVAQIVAGAAGLGVGGTAPFGGAGRFLGTNPFSVGVPTDGPDPVMIDFATTVLAEGKLRVYRAKHDELPPGVIIDPDGRPSTDVEDYYRGGMMLPIGDHKGYCLSLAAALLGGLAAIGEDAPSPAGAAVEPPPETASRRTGGVFVLVIDPGAFGDPSEYQAAVTRVTQSVKAVPPTSGVDEVLIPGEPEFRARQERQRSGIAVPDDTWDDLSRTAARFGITMPAAAA